MENNKAKYVSTLVEERREIRQFLQELNVFDVTKLYEKLKDNFYMYGFTIDEVKQFLNYNGDYYEFSEDKLKQMEGISNALLFQLKYKLNSEAERKL